MLCILFPTHLIAEVPCAVLAVSAATRGRPRMAPATPPLPNTPPGKADAERDLTWLPTRSGDLAESWHTLHAGRAPDSPVPVHNLRPSAFPRPHGDSGVLSQPPRCVCLSPALCHALSTAATKWLSRGRELISRPMGTQEWHHSGCPHTAIKQTAWSSFSFLAEETTAQVLMARL